MPMQQIGYGLAVVGMVGTAAILSVAVVADHESGSLVVPAIFAFATSTIGGVLAVLGKLELISNVTNSTNSMVNGHRAEALEKMRVLEATIAALIKEATIAALIKENEALAPRSPSTKQGT